MTDKKENNLFDQTDEEWEAMIAGFSDEELIAYFERIREARANDLDAFPGFTDEMAEDLKATTEKFKESVKQVKIAELDLAIARKNVEIDADNLLRILPDTGKGN